MRNRIDESKLSVKRKPDRAIMAGEIMALLRQYPEIKITLEKEGEQGNWRGKRCTAITLQHDTGLSVSIELNGDSSQPGVFILPWHFRGMSDTKLAESFGVAAGASINPHHRRKCMPCYHGFADMMDGLKACLEVIKNEKAFL